jgi:hypothetical protein
VLNPARTLLVFGALPNNVAQTTKNPEMNAGLYPEAAETRQ